MVEARQAEPRSERTGARTDDLVADIARRVRVPVDLTPEGALLAVMCTLAQHVDAEAARTLFATIPGQPALVVRCDWHRDERPSRFGRGELIERVAEHLHVSMGDAEDITSAVVMATLARLPVGEGPDVVAHLPRELQELWVARRLAPPTEPHPIVLRIERDVVLPDGVDGVAAFASVIGMLSRRLSRGEARHFARTFSGDLRPLIEDYLDDRGERAAPFDHEEYLMLVAQEFDTDDIDQTEQVARTVFEAVQEYLRSDVYEHVMRQLPLRLQELWAV